MSDLEISGSDSEPVSDVNPEEMARLMADLDDMDNDLFKNTLKSTPSKEKDVKDSKRRVTFNEKSSSKKDIAKTSKDDDDEDWDADDLLQSDDELPKGKTPQKKVSPGATVPSSSKVASPSKKVVKNEDTNKTTTAKSKLMADLFSDEPSDANKTVTSPSAGGKKDKSKLMADLFGGNDATEEPKGPKAASDSSSRRGSAKKQKDEVLFDDDDDDILGGIGDKKVKSPSVSSPKGGGFLDSLLGKSSTAEKSKVKKEKQTEFILDDKYKQSGKDKKTEKSFGGYQPSSGTSNSPLRRTPKKAISEDPFDFLNDPEPRKRNPRSATQRKPFEVDDDDILGNIRSRKGKNLEQGKEATQNTPTKKERASPKSKDNDWLFGSSGTTDETMKKTMDETSIQASIEPRSSEAKTGTPNKSQDWLGNLLSSNKKSPSRHQQDASPTKPPAVKPSSPLSRNMPSSDSNMPSGANENYKIPPETDFAQSPSSFQQPQGMKTSASVQQEFLAKQQLLEAQAAASRAQMKAQQELVLQQQEAELQAASVAASQMKAQQEQLEAQMAQQLLQQQQEMKKMQEAAMKRYQEAMITPVSQFNLSPAVPENNSDDTTKELQVQLRKAEIDVAKLTTELELIRKQHSEEVALLEKSYSKKLEMEREVWEHTEKRLKEERNKLASDFDSKVSVLQAEKESLSSSHEVQLANVKKEWSQAVERTKELYSEMAQRMKAEHSAALERMTYLKDLELNAAVSASGQVKEVEVVMSQLESNTANLSDLTASINTRHDSALEMTQKALKVKEKQLQDFEAQLGASQAEAESERGRLNALINRLENTLIQQGSEVEKERWRLTQAQMKIEMERKALTEERRHLQITTETERQNLASARESLLAEHQLLLQSVAKEKQELATQRAQLTAQQKVAHLSNTGGKYLSRSMSQLDVNAEMEVLSEEYKVLKEKMTSLTHQEQHLNEEERRLEQLNMKLEQDKVKMAVEKDFLSQEKLSLKKHQEETDAVKQSSEILREQQQIRLSQITAQTQALHIQQEKVEKERLKLEQAREEISHLIQLGICPSCQNRGITGSALELTAQYSNRRLPGDGGEGQSVYFAKAEANSNASMSPASVLARLVAARERENLERERRLLQISALESS